MASSLLAAFLLVSVASANFEANLNYNFPGAHLETEDSRFANPASLRPDLQFWKSEALDFIHGVASGDPNDNSIILWTRVTVSPTLEPYHPDSAAKGRYQYQLQGVQEPILAPLPAVCVEWKISCNSTLEDVVDRGIAYTTADIDYTVKVEAMKLKPYTTYYYQFNLCTTNKTSPVGRTKTTPAPDDDVESLALAIFHGNNYADGYFNAMGNAARKDKVDYMIHLGGYINEGAEMSGPRGDNSSLPLSSLQDYRARYSKYRTDSDLILAHSDFPWLVTWNDDRNIATGPGASLWITNASAAPMPARNHTNAFRAFHEWLPVRPQIVGTSANDDCRIRRKFMLGKLLDLFPLDTAEYEESIAQAAGMGVDQLDWLDLEDQKNSFMGTLQETWLYRQLDQSVERNATWRIVGMPMSFSKPPVGALVKTEEWSAYHSTRTRILSHLHIRDTPNAIFLSSDGHMNSVSDIKPPNDDPSTYDAASGKGSLGVELSGAAVSWKENDNPGAKERMEAMAKIDVDANSELRWREAWYSGYYELHVDKNGSMAEYYATPTVTKRNPYEVSLASFTIWAGDKHAERSGADWLVVEAGGVKNGSAVETGLLLDTSTGEWGRFDVDAYTEGLAFWRELVRSL